MCWHAGIRQAPHLCRNHRHWTRHIARINGKDVASATTNPCWPFLRFASGFGVGFSSVTSDFGTRKRLGHPLILSSNFLRAFGSSWYSGFAIPTPQLKGWCIDMLKSAVAVACFALLLAYGADRPIAQKEKEINPGPEPAVTIVDNSTRQCDQNATRKEPSKPDAGLEWANWMLVLVGAATFVAVWMQAVQTKRSAAATERSADLSNRTLLAQMRPRIVVRTFYFSELRGNPMPRWGIENGSMASGQFYIVNTGGSDAAIEEIYCAVITGKTLPAKRPYEGREGSREKKVLGPGQSTFYLFGLPPREFLDEGTANSIKAGFLSLWVLGWIGYRDGLGIYRITRYCRRYDPIQERFHPVDDVEYESAD